MEPKTAYFGRCIFLSWYCDRGTCDFCFRSTTKHKIKHAENAKRSLASILTDAVIGKNLGWEIEFLTGGYGIFDFDEIVNIARLVSNIYGRKIWVNLGALSKDEMIKLQPYVEGICASIETIEPVLHDKICPDKPIQPYSDMLKVASDLGFKTSMTIVIGLGEKNEDFDILSEFIKKHELYQITYYALKPVQGTPYEKSPDIDYYAWWVRKTRETFPNIKIVTGLTPKKVDYVKEILLAGADGLTKFPALKEFNSNNAKIIESMVKEAGRVFQGSLTVLPEVDWDKEVESIDVDEVTKKSVLHKIYQYVSKMKS